jgi:hypothetical protein
VSCHLPKVDGQIVPSLVVVQANLGAFLLQTKFCITTFFFQITKQIGVEFCE